MYICVHNVHMCAQTDMIEEMRDSKSPSTPLLPASLPFLGKSGTANYRKTKTSDFPAPGREEGRRRRRRRRREGVSVPLTRNQGFFL
jgi:hypothetical protein